jgi:hypothetical protein
VQELRAELARKDKVVENLTKRCKTHEEASQRQLSSGRSEGTLQQFAERCAQQILAAAQKRRSCSAEEIIDYRGAAYQQELEREIPDFSGFLRATFLATLSNRPMVKRDDDALRTTQTQVFCSMAKYATSEFQHPLRVADTWFMQIKTKDDLLTDIFNREAPGGLSSGGVRGLTYNPTKAQVEAPGCAFLQKMIRNRLSFYTVADQFGDYGAGTSRASVGNRPEQGIHLCVTGVRHTTQRPHPPLLFDVSLTKLSIGQPDSEWKRFDALGTSAAPAVIPSAREEDWVREESEGMLGLALRYHHANPELRTKLGPDLPRDARSAPGVSPHGDAQDHTVECEWCGGINLASWHICRGCRKPFSELPDKQPTALTEQQRVTGSRRPRGGPRDQRTSEDVAFKSGPVSAVEHVLFRPRKLNPNTRDTRLQALDVVGEITGLETFGGTVGLAAGASGSSSSSSSSRGQQLGPAAEAGSSRQEQGPAAAVAAAGAKAAATPAAGTATGTAAAAATVEAVAAGSSSGQQRIQQLFMVLDGAGWRHERIETPHAIVVFCT